MEQQCQVPPSGWECTRGSGHAGPCAAVRTSFWAFTKQSMARATRQYFVPFLKSDKTKELEKLLEESRDHVMSAEEKEEQRRSFAHGNVALHNPAVTREVIDKAADDLSSATKGLIGPNPGDSNWDSEWTSQYYRIQILETQNLSLNRETQTLRKLVDAADYLQHCRRSEAEYPHFTLSVDANRKRVERASDHYDYLRGQVKL